MESVISMNNGPETNIDPIGDPHLPSAAIKGIEDPKIIGIWVNNNRLILIGLMEDRVDFHNLSKDKMETDYAHYVLNYVRSAESLLLLGPDDSKMELRRKLCGDKELATRLIAVEDCGYLEKPQLITKVQKFFDQKRNGGTSSASDTSRKQVLE